MGASSGTGVAVGGFGFSVGAGFAVGFAVGRTVGPVVGTRGAEELERGGGGFVGKGRGGVEVGMREKSTPEEVCPAGTDETGGGVGEIDAVSILPAGSLNRLVENDAMPVRNWVPACAR